MEISKLDAKDILELSKSLGGEDAMAELIRFIDYPMTSKVAHAH